MKLHDYQRTAMAHLQGNHRAALFLDMGLGKTAATLSALTPDHLPALVTAPKLVTERTWHTEAAKWAPHLKVGRAIGTPAERRAVLCDPSYDVVVLSRENLSDPATSVRRWRTFVIDELSGFKTRGARWKAARKIIMRGDVEYVWGLTGTPATNGMEGLWPQMYLLDSGHRLGRTVTAFRAKWFDAGYRLPTGAVINRKLLPGAFDDIMAQLSDICLSMKAVDYLQQPGVLWNTVDVELPPQVLKAYHSIRTDFVADLSSLGLGTDVITAPTASQVSNRFSQLSAGFVYEDKDVAQQEDRDQNVTYLHDARPDALEKIVEETGSPVLVAYRYRPELEMLKRRFGKAMHTVKSPDVWERWDAGKVPLLAAHPAAIGHGLNLQHGGHTIVWTSPTWDLELWDQFNGRLNRQGQQHPVVVHMLAAPGTVDEQVYDALRQKASVQDTIMEYLRSPV